MTKKTVKIRIACAVDPDGDWHACGWTGATDEIMMEIACETVAQGERRYFLEVELELPSYEADTIKVEKVYND